jgi:uncharacterized protein YbbK (DUF523 family)
MISACLLGINCRYDGGHSACSGLVDYVHDAYFMPFCPEQLGGLPTPRSPANMIGGDGYDILANKARVINADGEDVTNAFIRGAEEANSLAMFSDALIAIMKDRSPSCGLYTPVFENPAGHGFGVTAALFQLRGIKLFEAPKDGHFSRQEFLAFLKTAKILQSM